MGKGRGIVVGALAGGRIDVAVERALGVRVCVVGSLVDGRADAAVVGGCVGHGVGACASQGTYSGWSYSFGFGDQRVGVNGG